MEITINSSYFISMKKSSPEYRLSLIELSRNLAPEKYYWKTKDGIEVAINEMSNSHLINTYNLVCKPNRFPSTWNGKRRVEWVIIFSKEMLIRRLI